MSMTEKVAEEMGMRAMRRGDKCASLMDVEFMNALPVGNVENCLRFFKAWKRGWNNASRDEEMNVPHWWKMVACL